MSSLWEQLKDNMHNGRVSADDHAVDLESLQGLFEIRGCGDKYPDSKRLTKREGANIGYIDHTKNGRWIFQSPNMLWSIASAV